MSLESLEKFGVSIRGLRVGREASKLEAILIKIRRHPPFIKKADDREGGLGVVRKRRADVERVASA